MNRQSILFLAITFAVIQVFPAFAKEKEEVFFEINLSRFVKPTAKERDAIDEWFIDLQTTPMLADRIAFVATGETFIAASVDGQDQVNARRFAFSWLIDSRNNKERIVFGDDSTIQPIAVEGKSTRVMYSSSSMCDQLRIGKVFYCASGDALHKPSKTKSLIGVLKRRGAFFPILASTCTAMSIYNGDAYESGKSQVKIENLVGVQREKSLLFAEFEYRPVPEIAFFRIVIFKDGDPIQVDDWIASNGLKMSPLVRGVDRDRKELAELHKVAKPYARTLTTWSKVGDLHVPTSIKSSTLSGPNAIEVNAEFAWRINDQVPDSAFTIETVGQVGPLSLLK